MTPEATAVALDSPLPPLSTWCRQTLVDLCTIDSTTGREAELLPRLCQELRRLGAEVETIPVDGRRANILARWTDADRVRVLLSTHLDTVPPYLPPRPSAIGLRGRGSCDAKGQIVAQLGAIRRLLASGHREVAWLGVIGEETDSLGASAAARWTHRWPCLKGVINGEPTENRLPSGQKGLLHLELLCHGQRAHGSDATAADPALGTNALWRLHDWLAVLPQLELADDPDFGTEVVNLGRLDGGEAANVVPGQARAEILARTVPGSTLLRQCRDRVPVHGELMVRSESPPLRFGRPSGWPKHLSSPAVGFGSDAGRLATLLPAGAADRIFLLGPGSIASAHTDHEQLSWAELEAGVRTIHDLAHGLLDARGDAR